VREVESADKGSPIVPNLAVPYVDGKARCDASVGVQILMWVTCEASHEVLEE